MSSELKSHLADYEDLPWSALNAPPIRIDQQAGHVEFARKRRKVVIYGAGRGRSQAPLKDLEWEVWCLNLIPALVDDGIRADRWFDIHQRRAQTEKDLLWIARMPRPIYVPDDLLNAGPNTVRFPFEQLEAAYPQRPIWACTFAYQIALALHEGFTDIGMFGVELAYGTRRERTVEWASVSWWMGYAEAKGVTFHLPAGTRLGHHRYRYGLEYQEEIDEVKRYIEYTHVADRLEDEQQRASVGG